MKSNHLLFLQCMSYYFACKIILYLKLQGLDLAIALMDVSEIADIEVHPRFAYGDLGLKPDIPPNTIVTYTVELKAIESDTDIEMLSIKQRKELG